ncbi:hypothetical protein K8T06_17315, partial [bacterium]|nr:hypothetical protein [bacterium]
MNCFKRLMFMAVAGIFLLSPGMTASAVILTDHEIVEGYAGMHNLPADNLKVIYRTDMDLPLSGIKGERVKIIDNDISVTYCVAVNESGNILDYKELKSHESELHRAKYGRLDVLLYEELQQMDDLDEVEVVLWLVSETREFG